MSEHPDAYLKELAQNFNCTEGALRKALKRIKITQKKDIDKTLNKLYYKKISYDEKYKKEL